MIFKGAYSWSPICWIHEWRGRSGRRRQPWPKREPVLAAATCDNARWAGVWSSWPNNEFRLLAMRRQSAHVSSLGDGTPFSIRAKWSKARRRGHSGLTQRTSAVYAIWWWWWWRCIRGRRQMTRDENRLSRRVEQKLQLGHNESQNKVKDKGVTCYIRTYQGCRHVSKAKTRYTGWWCWWRSKIEQPEILLRITCGSRN